MHKGMLVYTLRCAALGDCTNGGHSATFDKFILIGDGIPELFASDVNTPALILVKGTPAGRPYMYATPVHAPSGLIGPMFGGNYITSSDSRMPQAVIPVHDRFETGEQYASNY